MCKVKVKNVRHNLKIINQAGVVNLYLKKNKQIQYFRENVAGQKCLPYYVHKSRLYILLFAPLYC